MIKILVLNRVILSVKFLFYYFIEWNSTNSFKIIKPFKNTKYTFKINHMKKYDITCIKVSSDGKITGVKVGTCDINCRAEYSKFLIFKDVVNYVFHISVIDSKIDSLTASPKINVDSDNLFSYKEDWF